jgi:MFS transporter, DHA2 family, multidrug resistance protein
LSSYQEALEKKVAQSGEIVRWMITVAVSLGALLEVIDTSIVNVALPHIQGNLGATLSEAGWVITGYAIANAIMIPLTAWLGTIYGRKSYFIFSMIGFTAASILCGFAPNLITLVVARILQGLFGGGLLAKAQAILFESFPREKQGLAQGIFGICVIVGPIIGPTLGGYLTDTLNWRWIFFINLPFGILATTLCSIFLPSDGESTASGKVDWAGILYLIMAIGSFQYVLEKGQDDDWFSSKTILALSIMAVLGLILFLRQELTCANPAVNLRVLRHTSVAGGVAFSLIMGMALFGTAFAIPTFAQSVLNYTAMQSGMLQLPGSLASAVLMPFTGLIAARFDARLLVGMGTVISALVMFNLAGINTDTSANDFFWPLIWRGFAIVITYMPLTLATLGNCPVSEIASASAFFNLSRQLGGSIGIAAMTTLLTQRNDFHRTVLIEKVTAFNPQAIQHLQAYGALLKVQGASTYAASHGALQMLQLQIMQQASVLSFEDANWLVGVLLCSSLVFLFLLNSGRRTNKPILEH